MLIRIFSTNVGDVHVSNKQGEKSPSWNQSAKATAMPRDVWLLLVSALSNTGNLQPQEQVPKPLFLISYIELNWREHFKM